MKYKTSDKLRQYNREYMRVWRERNKEKCCQYQREWKERNKEHWLQYKKEWRENHTEERKNYFRSWYLKNKERVIKRAILNSKRRYHKVLKHNPKHKLYNNMAVAIYHALKGNKAGRKWETLVGYTLKDLTKHLEVQFDENMFWYNYGTYWWIDHIKPRSAFNFETAEDSEFKKCWALSNLQPMEAIANIKKGNKYG